MAILRSIPRSRKMPSLRNVVMIDTVRGVLRVRKWPKKYGKARSALQQYWIDWFRQANLLAKYADGAQQARAIAMTKGSGLYPRDVMLKAMRGRLYTWADTTGWKWYPMAAIQDVSDSLDALAQTVGSILVRASDRWRDAAAGIAGDVLTNMGPGVAPEWQPAAGGGGFGGGALAYRSSAWSLPNAAFTAIPLNAELYDTAGIHESAINPTRMTVPAGVTWAKCTAALEFAANTTGVRIMILYKNGAAFIGQNRMQTPATGNSWTRLSLVGQWVPVVPGDYFELLGYQNSGSARSIGTLPEHVSFSLEIA